MRANIHAKGRPDWRFIKVHTHATCVAVQALGAQGQVLGTSAVKTLPGYAASAHPPRGPR